MHQRIEGGDDGRRGMGQAIRLLGKAIRLNPDDTVRFIRPHVCCGLRKFAVNAMAISASTTSS